MNKKWTDQEKQFIKDNVRDLTDEKLAEEMTQKFKRIITINALRKQRQKMGIGKKPGRGICGLVGE